MKRLLFSLAILFSFAGFSQGNFPVPVGSPMQEAADFRARVIDSGGTYYNNIAPHEISKRSSYGLNPIFEFYPAAVETSVAFSHKPVDGSGDFTVARTSIKTRVNEDGYLEEIAANIAAIDYLSGVPSLNTESQSTNLITYSNEFGNSYWTKSGATIEGDTSSAGSELVSGGDFESGLYGTLLSGDETSTWTLNTSSPISGTQDGLLQVTATGTNTLRPKLTMAGAIVDITKIYILSFDYRVNSGTCVLEAYNHGTAAVFVNKTLTGSGTYSIQISPTANTADFGALYFQNANLFNVQIDNYSIKEVTGFQSPSKDYPTDGYKLVEDGSTGEHSISRSVTTTTNPHTLSIYAKYVDAQWVALREWNTGKGYYFDILNGAVGSAWSGYDAPDDYSITSLQDGWYRLSITVTTGTTGTLRFYLASADGTYSYTGSNKSVEIFGANLTETPYAPPFIYTNGATATMTADAITGAGDATLFSSVNSSGVLFAEIAAHSDDGTGKNITICDGSNANRVYINTLASNQIAVTIFVGSVSQASITHTLTDITNFNKIAFKWSENDFALWINGVEVGTDNSGSTFPSSTLNDLRLASGSLGTPFYGKLKQLAVYNYLTDDEIKALTEMGMNIITMFPLLLLALSFVIRRKNVIEFKE